MCWFYTSSFFDVNFLSLNLPAYFISLGILSEKRSARFQNLILDTTSVEIFVSYFFFFFNCIYYCSSLWIQSHVILKTLLLHILVRLHTLSFASIFRKLHLKITLAGAQQETLQCKEDSLEQGHLDKHYIYNTCKKNPVKLILGVFSCRYSWNYCILNKKLNHTIKTVFPKSGHIFSISRKRQRRPSPHRHRSSCVSVG